MTINQLFQTKPSVDLVNKILNIYGYESLESISKDVYFSKKDLELNNFLDKYREICEELKEHYLPCKKKIYFENITLKKALTVLRQLLKLYNYKLVSNDKYMNGKKIIIYNIMSKLNTENNTNCVVTFD